MFATGNETIGNKAACLHTNLVTSDHLPDQVASGLFLQRPLSQPPASACLYPGLGDGVLALCPAYLYTGSYQLQWMVLVLLTSAFS